MEGLITPFYAGFLGLLLLILSIRVILNRRSLQVAIGHGNQPKLERAMRVQANFAEYVPLCLLLLFMLEMSSGGGGTQIHSLCILLLAGRCLHAYGVSQQEEKLPIRVAGMVMTFVVLVATSLSLVWNNL